MKYTVFQKYMTSGLLLSHIHPAKKKKKVSGRKPLSKMLFFAGSNIIFEDDIVVDGSLGVSQQRHWHPSEMTCADQRVDPSFEAAEAVNIH